MPLKNLPVWDAAAGAELIEECFPFAVRDTVQHAADRIVATVHALNALDPESHLDLFDASGLADEWAVRVENVSTGRTWELTGAAAGQIAWALDELWQDAPFAMSPVRFHRLAFRIFEEYAFVPLRNQSAIPSPETLDEFVGDLLSLILGPHRNLYAFGWWQSNHGRFRK